MFVGATTIIILLFTYKFMIALKINHCLEKKVATKQGINCHGMIKASCTTLRGQTLLLANSKPVP